MPEGMSPTRGGEMITPPPAAIPMHLDDREGQGTAVSTAVAWLCAYHNQLNRELQSNCRFHFHDDEWSAQLTGLEITLLHEQLVNHPGKPSDCSVCLFSPLRHELFLCAL